MSQKTAKKQAVVRKDMTKAQWTWHEIKAGKMGYVLVAPFMFLFFMFLRCFIKGKWNPLLDEK